MSEEILKDHKPYFVAARLMSRRGQTVTSRFVSMGEFDTLRAADQKAQSITPKTLKVTETKTGKLVEMWVDVFRRTHKGDRRIKRYVNRIAQIRWI